jgi:hypothetical protein
MLFRVFLAGIGIGSLLAYFLDPHQGRRRRALVRDRLDTVTGEGLVADPHAPMPRDNRLLTTLVNTGLVLSSFRRPRTLRAALLVMGLEALADKAGRRRPRPPEQIGR